MHVPENAGRGSTVTWEMNVEEEFQCSKLRRVNIPRLAPRLPVLPPPSLLTHAYTQQHPLLKKWQFPLSHPLLPPNHPIIVLCFQVLVDAGVRRIPSFSVFKNGERVHDGTGMDPHQLKQLLLYYSEDPSANNEGHVHQLQSSDELTSLVEVSSWFSRIPDLRRHIAGVPYSRCGPAAAEATAALLQLRPGFQLQGTRAPAAAPLRCTSCVHQCDELAALLEVRSCPTPLIH